MSSIKAPKRTFDEMFDTNTTVDFTENLSDTFVMSTPHPNDKLVETYKKVAKLAALVQKGKSLAIHTGYTEAIEKECDAITEAKEDMLPSEIEQFDAWVAGAAMPTVDWKNSRKPVRLSEDEEAHFNQQFRAIQQIYQSRKITRENAYWFMSNFGYVLPLIEAVAMVRLEQQKIVREREGLTEMELAELETARSIIGIATGTLRKREFRLQFDPQYKEQLELEWVADKVREACKVIQVRADEIHGKAVQYNEGMRGLGFPRAKE